MLAGKKLLSVELKDYSWFFEFSDGVIVATESPWRLILSKGIVVTSEDHGHPFGLPQPVDAAERVQSRIVGQTATLDAIDPTTGDLTIEFGSDARLQFLQLSCGYESWRIDTDRNMTAVCTGGGRVEFFTSPDGGSVQ